MKIIVPILVIALSSVASNALADSSFRGLYLGAGATVRNTTIKSDWNSTLVNSGTLNFSSSHSGSATGLLANFVLGYGEDIGNGYYVAPELAFSSGSDKTVDTTGASQTNGSGSFYSQNQAAIENQFSLGMKLGAYLTPNDLIYLKPAISYGELVATQGISQVNSNQVFQSTNVDKYIAGGQIGVGYEHAVTQKLAVQGELNYVRFQSYNLLGTNYKPSELLASISAVYKF